MVGFPSIAFQTLLLIHDLGLAWVCLPGKVAAEKENAEVDEGRIDGREDKLEGVGGENDLPHHGPLEPETIAQKDAVHDDGVEKLGDHRRPVVSKPEVTVLGHPLDEMKKPGVGQLSHEVGRHGAEDENPG